VDKIIDALIGRSRTILSLLILILILGSISYKNIPKEREPDVQIPVIYVSMSHEGISPEDAERLLIRPMEKELRSVEGVKEMTAYATEGRASVTMEFHAGFNSEKALNDIREKVDAAKAKLPSDTDEPEVNEINLSLFPVVSVILTGDVPYRALISLAQELRDKIEELPNVLSVDIAGDREEVVEVIIDPLKIESYGITSEVINAVSTSFNKLVAAGAMDNDNGRYAVKIPGLLETADDILSLPVKINNDAIITVRDIAEVRKTYKDSTGYARVNGKSAIALEVSKRTGTNIIETISQVKQVVKEAQKYWPSQIKTSYAQDRSTVIKRILGDLQNNVILAVLLVTLVILYFIGLRAAALIAIAIPGSFLIGILIIDGLGMTLNIVVLFGLILSIGMLVDSAIIISEMADRKMISGVDNKKAFALSTKYMKWPIIVSTLTTLIVFMPLLFWPGIMGQFMKYLPITLIATLSGSLFMAIIFLPTLGTIWGGSDSPKASTINFIRVSESGSLSDLTGFTKRYYSALKWVLTNPRKFVYTIILSLVGVLVYSYLFGTGLELFPNIEPESGQVQVRARGNLSVKEKDTLLKSVEEKIYDLKNEVKIFYARSGELGQEGGHQLPEDTIGVIQMEYEEWGKRRKAHLINDEIVARSAEIPGIIVQTIEQKPGPKEDKPIVIDISSQIPELISPVLTKIRKKMEQSNGFIAIEDTRPTPEIEWKMEVNKELAARFGVNIQDIGNMVKLVTNGLLTAKYRPSDSDDEVDIVNRFPKEKRNIKTLDILRIATNKGNVPISNFVTRSPQQKLQIIRRTEGNRVMTIKADVKEGVLADNQITKIKQWLEAEKIDPRVRIKFKGEDQEQKEAMVFLQGAFLLALIGMALLLITQFNSIYNMVIIMSAVFLSTTGVIIGLIITNQPFGIVMCGVGIIALSGIVVNNNIIFIDTFQKLKNEGMDVTEALLRTGVQRLRPILLTAGTTVLGLIPMVLSMNINFLTRELTFGAPSSQWWNQLSTSIAGGLTFATILTLFFTPSLLLLGNKFQERLIKKHMATEYS